MFLLNDVYLFNKLWMWQCHWQSYNEPSVWMSWRQFWKILWMQWEKYKTWSTGNTVGIMHWRSRWLDSNPLREELAAWLTQTLGRRPPPPYSIQPHNTQTIILTGSFKEEGPFFCFNTQKRKYTLANHHSINRLWELNDNIFHRHRLLQAETLDGELCAWLSSVWHTDQHPMCSFASTSYLSSSSPSSLSSSYMKVIQT